MPNLNKKALVEPQNLPISIIKDVKIKIEKNFKFKIDLKSDLINVFNNLIAK